MGAKKAVDEKVVATFELVVTYEDIPEESELDEILEKLISRSIVR